MQLSIVIFINGGEPQNWWKFTQAQRASKGGLSVHLKEKYMPFNDIENNLTFAQKASWPTVLKKRLTEMDWIMSPYWRRRSASHSATAESPAQLAVGVTVHKYAKRLKQR